MPPKFDPYHKWLGIAPDERPIHFYRLLGVKLYEDDVDVISVAADRQMAHVKTFATGKYAEVSQKILNELGQAKVCLTSFEAKLNYDIELRNHLSGPAPSIETESRRTSDLFEQLDQFGPQESSAAGVAPVATPIRVPKRVETTNTELPIAKLAFGLLGLLLGLFLIFVIGKSIVTLKSRSEDGNSTVGYEQVVDQDATVMAGLATRSLERFDCRIDLKDQPIVQRDDNHYVVTTNAYRDRKLVECMLEYWRDDSQGSPRWKLTKVTANDEVLYESP